MLRFHRVLVSLIVVVILFSTFGYVGAASIESVSSIEDGTDVSAQQTYNDFVLSDHAITRTATPKNSVYISDDGTKLYAVDNSAKLTELHNGTIGNISYTIDHIYFTDNNRIIRIGRTNNNKEVVLDGFSAIVKMDVVEELIYFAMNGAIYRLSTSGYGLQKMADYSQIVNIRAVSSTKVVWTEVNLLAPERQPGMEPDPTAQGADRYFVYDSINNEKKQISSGEYQELYEIGNGDAYNAQLRGMASSYTIYGTTMPLANYPSYASWFNLTGDTPNDPATSGKRDCNHSVSTATCRSFDGATQCWGFANYIFFTTWHTYRSGKYIDLYRNCSGNSKATLLKEALQDIPLGSHVRVGNTNSGNGNHSFILLSLGDTSFVVYEANIGGNCKVRMYEHSYGGYNYDCVLFYYHPCANSTHTASDNHNYVYTPVGGSGSGTQRYRVTCSRCAYVGYVVL